MTRNKYKWALESGLVTDRSLSSPVQFWIFGVQILDCQLLDLTIVFFRRPSTFTDRSLKSVGLWTWIHDRPFSVIKTVQINLIVVNGGLLTSMDRSLWSEAVEIGFLSMKNLGKARIHISCYEQFIQWTGRAFEIEDHASMDGDNIDGQQQRTIHFPRAKILWLSCDCI